MLVCSGYGAAAGLYSQQVIAHGAVYLEAEYAAALPGPAAQWLPIERETVGR